MHNILVVKLADIGDVLTATPALRALRQELPRCSHQCVGDAGLGRGPARPALPGRDHPVR